MQGRFTLVAVAVAFFGLLGLAFFACSSQGTGVSRERVTRSAADTTFVVTNTNDSDAGSLREAINESNADDAGANLIQFNIPGSDPNCTDAGICTITPGSALPTITQAVTIDGYSQPGASPATADAGAKLEIVLSGASAGGANGLTIDTTSCTVQGLVINGGFNAGVFLEFGGGSTVQGNYLGTDVTGTTAVPNGFGIEIQQSPNNTFGGTTPSARNILSGNTLAGMFMGGSPRSTGNVVEGNYIGTDRSGTTAVPNGGVGIDVSDSSTNNLIGGTTAAARNIISGNGSLGVRMLNSATDINIEGNYIGTDVSGMHALANVDDGVQCNGAGGNNIGGTATGTGNVISGNGRYGVHFTGFSEGNHLYGNIIGTAADGVTPLGNTSDGVFDEALINFIGVADAGNVICANGGSGVNLNANGETVSANFIGIAANGTTTGLGSTNYGVLVNNGGSVIGGSSTSDGNTIFNNGLDGVIINSGSTTGVLTNSIDLNGGLGIHVVDGANNSPVAPVMSSARASKKGTPVAGSLTNAREPNTMFTIQFFASPACDPTGTGEGRTFLQQITVTTNASGVATFSQTLTATVPKKQVVTATATDSNRNTSQFSNCVTAK